MPSDRQLGMRIRYFRNVFGVTQSELAEHLSVSFQQLQKYEQGHNRITAIRLYKVANYLGVNLSDFFNDNEQAENEDLDRSSQQLIKYYHLMASERLKHLLIVSAKAYAAEAAISDE